MANSIEFKLFVSEELGDSTVRLRWIVSPPSTTVTLETGIPERGFDILAADQTAVRTYRDQPPAPRYYRLRVGASLSEIIKGSPLLPDWPEKAEPVKAEPVLSTRPTPAPTQRLSQTLPRKSVHAPKNQSWRFWLLLLAALAGIGFWVALMINESSPPTRDSRDWLNRPEWLTARTAAGEFSREKGAYEIRPTGKSAVCNIQTPFDFSKDFAVEVTVEGLDNELPSAGLNLDIENDQSYLTLRINREGQFYFQQLVEGDRYYTHRRGYVSTPATKFSGPNTLRIERKNESLRALINGQIVAREKQFLSGSRRVGLAAFGSGARFSHFHIVGETAPKSTR